MNWLTAIDLLQVEYTRLAAVGQDFILRADFQSALPGVAATGAGGRLETGRRMKSCPTVIVEHDVTYDLYWRLDRRRR